MWLNFLPIYDKNIGDFGFANVWDTQYHMALYEEIAQHSYKHCAILKKRQIASEQPHSEPVLGEYGWTTMGDIKINDKLWNPDGTLTTVIAKSNNGLSDVYEFVFHDGRKTRCGIEHNWEVYDRNEKKQTVLNTKQLLEKGLNSCNTFDKKTNKDYTTYRFAIPLNKCLDYTQNEELPISPYVLGCILGDGSISHTVYICGKDKEIFDEISKELGEDYELRETSGMRRTICIKNKFNKTHTDQYENGRFGCNPLLRELCNLGVKVNDKGVKHIPEVYMKASKENRIALIQGLMDTDGFVNSNGNDVHFTNTNKTLIDDFTEVARSLGLKVLISTKTSKDGSIFYRARISGLINIPLFRLTRKRERIALRKNKNTHDLVPLVAINKLDYQEESSCIIVDNPNRLYITKDFIVTHNSYFHSAQLINRFWFESGAVCKMAASLQDYINHKGTWRFLEEYRNFLNSHTAWYRPCNPDKMLNWEQKIEITQNGRKRDIGLKSSLIGLVLDKDVTKGVGGACVAPDTLIQMYDKSLKKAKDIKMSDKILGIDGKPKKIKQLFAGENQMYKVDQSKGLSYIVTEDHLLYLYDKNSKVPVTIQAKDFDKLSYRKKRNVLKGIKVKGYECPEKNVTIDPYYLGLYLGDGCKYDYKILVNYTKDPEIYEYVENLAEKLGYRLSTKIKNKYRNDYNFNMIEVMLSKEGNKDKNITSMKSLFKTLNLNIKHIPDVYFQTSLNQRLELLAGILDTDGYYNKNKNRYEIHIKDEKLKNDVIRLCVSVGLDAHWYKIIETNKTSTVVNKTTCGYRLRITGDLTKIPCKIARKKAFKNGIKNVNRFSTVKVTPIGKGNYNGFECEDNLFILEDGTITHNCTLFFHEEAGIAPKMNKTLEYLLPALKSGMVYTGMSIVAGSVGELSAADPLKDIIFKPNTKDVLAVKTNLLDEKGTIGECGLFIPEQWSMPPFIDQYGNSLVEEALAAILQERIELKKELTPSDYQLRVSQHPTNIKEAFAYREESPFPQHLITKQIERIQNGEYFLENVDLLRGMDGKVQISPSNKVPITDFPINPSMVDKSGIIVMHERPPDKPKFGTYYASLDPIAAGKTTASNSLASLYIYKNAVEVTFIKEDGTIEHRIEPDKLVCWWTGRFDDIKKTHERIEMMLELYNAWCIVENNVTAFIQYMQEKNKQRYLVPKNQLVFLKDLGANVNVYQDYGWRNVGRLFKDNILPYGIQFLSEELDHEVKPDGTIVKTYYGIERIPDIMLLREMQNYQEGKNFDRLIAYSALASFIIVQSANRGVVKQKKYEKENLENIKKSSNLNINPFNSIGSKGKKGTGMSKKMSFKNIR
jgi:hypothetical protein